MKLRWLVPALLLLATSAHADPGWTLGVAFPWDVMHTDGETDLGVFGLGLDVARTLDDRWTLGVAAEGSFVMDIRPDAPIGSEVEPMGRLRVGLEWRYIVATGTAWATQRCGPDFEVQARTWIGGRAGVETFDEGTTFGRFAEVVIGRERVFDHVAFGPYFAAGVSDEPAAFAAPVIRPYATIGIRIGGA